MLNVQRIGQLQKMVEADGFNQTAHFQLGQEYMTGGHFMQAAAEFRRTVELNPDYPAAWRAMGDAYEKAGVPKEAAASFRHGIRIAEKTGDVVAGRDMESRLAKIPTNFNN